MQTSNEIDHQPWIKGITKIDPDAHPEYETYVTRMINRFIAKEEMYRRVNLPVIHTQLTSMTLKTLIDTGAEASLIDYETFMQLFSQLPKHQQQNLQSYFTLTLRGVSGSPLTVHGSY
jgi:hypothetical protein